MQRRWKHRLYTTDVVNNPEEGWIALRLHRQDGGASTIAARIVFWDADGQFRLESLERELPLAILEDLIVEAKSTIKTR